MPRVLVIGSANMDFTVAVPRLPAEGETVTGGSFYVSHGGKGANQAVAARRLGGDVRFVGCVGQDPQGDRVVEQLAAEGIPTDGVIRTEAATGVALITVDREGRNQIAVASGANLELLPDLAKMHASLMPSIAFSNCHMTSFFSGLPKLRQSVRARGAAPVAVMLRAASATAMAPPVYGSR